MYTVAGQDYILIDNASVTNKCWKHPKFQITYHIGGHR